MIAGITRLLLLIQAFWVVAIGVAAIESGSIHHPALAFLVGLGTVLTMRLAITIHNFALARRFRSPLPEDCRLNWHQTCCLVLQEFHATMKTSSWNMPFQCFGKRIVAKPAGLPVLLVHGYGCNSGYWQSMSKALSKVGISHYAIDLEPVLGSIDSYTATIRHAVDTLCRETGRQKIVIVAHSMGGLAARAYLRDDGCDRISKIITLGTPHHGTALAQHAVGINTQQMRWTPNDAHGAPSAWLQSLCAGEDDATRVLFVSIYSHHDNIISPQTSSHLPGAKNIPLHGIGHVALALHPRVQALVTDEILHAHAPLQGQRPHLPQCNSTLLQ